MYYTCTCMHMGGNFITKWVRNLLSQVDAVLENYNVRCDHEDWVPQVDFVLMIKFRSIFQYQYQDSFSEGLLSRAPEQLTRSRWFKCCLVKFSAPLLFVLSEQPTEFYFLLVGPDYFMQQNFRNIKLFINNIQVPEEGNTLCEYSLQVLKFTKIIWAVLNESYFLPSWKVPVILT